MTADALHISSGLQEGDEGVTLTARLLEILLLPDGGYLMAIAEVYFDESEDGGRLLCLGGYIFEKGACIALCAAWRKVLRKHGLVYFRMVECAHGNGQFKGRAKEERIEVQTALIDLIKKYAARGFVNTFELQYGDLLPSVKSHGIDVVSPYSLLAFYCLIGVRHWAEQTNFKGKVAYFFESGHASAAEANKIMADVFKRKDAYRYGSHTFADKHDVLPLQCADILAWQTRKYMKDRLAGNTRLRADFHSLMDRPEVEFQHFDAAKIAQFLEVARKTTRE